MYDGGWWGAGKTTIPTSEETAILIFIKGGKREERAWNNSGIAVGKCII